MPGKRCHSLVSIFRDCAREVPATAKRLLRCARRMMTSVNCMEELNRANSAGVGRRGSAALN